MHAYTFVVIDKNMSASKVHSKVHMVKELRAVTGFGLKQSVDIVDAALGHHTKTASFEVAIPFDHVKYNTNNYGISKIIDCAAETKNQQTSNIVTGEMTVLLAIMKRSVITENESMHRAVVALIDQIFLEQK